MSFEKPYYAHAYYNGAGLTLSASGPRIITTLTLGVAAGFVLDAGADSLTVPAAGIYKITYNVSAKDNTTTNNAIQCFLCHSDNVANVLAGSYSNAYCVTQNRALCIAGGCIAELTAGQLIEMAIANNTTASHDILIEKASIYIHRID